MDREIEENEAARMRCWSLWVGVGKIDEDEAVRMRYCKLGVRWVGGWVCWVGRRNRWVGGWVDGRVGRTSRRTRRSSTASSMPRPVEGR